MALHSWQFVGTHIGGGTPGNDVPMVAAVCNECGEARTARALPTGPEYDRVDLSGQCPRHPDHQPARFTALGGK